MLNGPTLTPENWTKFVTKFVDDAHEFAGFELPAGCRISRWLIWFLSNR